MFCVGHSHKINIINIGPPDMPRNFALETQIWPASKFKTGWSSMINVEHSELTGEDWIMLLAKKIPEPQIKTTRQEGEAVLFIRNIRSNPISSRPASLRKTCQLLSLILMGPKRMLPRPLQATDNNRM